MKKKIYLIPNAITAFGLICSLFVIFKVNMVESEFLGHYQLLFSSLLLLLVAAFADLLDGAVARFIKGESEFGVIFDNLADAISFGVTPSVLLLKTLSPEPRTGLAFFTVIGAMIYSICGVLRLVRFNVSQTKREELNREEALVETKNFTGLPIPASAIAAVSTNLFFISPLRNSWFDLSPTLMAIILTLIWIGLGLLMVSRWKFPSLKTLRFKVPSLPLLLITVILAIFILYGVLHFFPVVLLLTSWGYILLGLVLSTIRLIAGKKSKTLEDFEPDEEDLE